MPATGYTPILLYGSSTASAVPAAANLTNGTGGSEIAINITDGRLYYKDNNGAVQIIGAKLNSVLAASLASAPVGTGNVVLASALGSDAESVVNFGGVGDNVYDNTTAFGNLFAVLGVNYLIPSGKFKTTATASISYANGGTYAFDGAPMPAAVYGVGPQSSIMCPSTTGQSAISANSTASASIMEARYRDFCISGRNNINNVSGLNLNVVEMMTLDNLRFEQLSTGVICNSVEYLTATKCFFEGNTNGLSSSLGTGGFTHLNASTFKDCIFDRNTANGVLITDNCATTNFIGGQVSNNGVMGVSGTAGLNISVTGAEGSNGVNIDGVYFEGNAGDADIKITNTGTNKVVHTINGCNFNRVSGSTYTTHNIVSTGPNIIVLTGCTFKGFNGYTASSARPYLSGDSNTQFIIGPGCYFDNATESGPAPKQNLLSSYWANYNASGGSLLPANWTATFNGAGSITFTHNLNSNYTLPFVQVLDPGFDAQAYITGLTPQSFTVGTRNSAGTYVTASLLVRLDVLALN